MCPKAKDSRNKIIGGRKRANTRWHLLLWRLKNTHKPRNRKYAGITLEITKEEFIEWFMQNDYAGCSVDRKHNVHGYVLHNMQLLPTGVNAGKDKIQPLEEFRTCKVCGLTKPRELMKKSSRRKNVEKICKACDAAQSRARRRKVYFDRRNK